MAKTTTTTKKTPTKKVTTTKASSAKKVSSSKAASTEKTVRKPAAPKVRSVEFAIIETGGKQYKVHVGDIVTIEKLQGDIAEGSIVKFDKVVLTDDGKVTKLGAPYLSGAVVSGELLKSALGPKLHVIQFRSKSNYHRKLGHRQPFMKVRITSVK